MRSTTSAPTLHAGLEAALLCGRRLLEQDLGHVLDARQPVIRVIFRVTRQKAPQFAAVHYFEATGGVFGPWKPFGQDALNLGIAKIGGVPQSQLAHSRVEPN